MISKAFTVDHATHIGVAGTGAVVCAMVQMQAPIDVGDNVRDAVLVAGGLILSAMGSSYVRAFGLGFGAVAFGSIIRRVIQGAGVVS